MRPSYHANFTCEAPNDLALILRAMIDFLRPLADA